MALAASVLLLVACLADWSQLKAALHQLGDKPWLAAILLFAYTGAFLLRAVAWRVLTSNRIHLYQLFVSIQAGLLVNHLAPVKLGEKEGKDPGTRQVEALAALNRVASGLLLTQDDLITNSE